MGMSVPAYADAVERIYAASVDPDAWPAAMEAIRAGFDAFVVAFVATAPGNHPIVANAGLPAEAIASYEAYYGRLDQVAQRFGRGGTRPDIVLPADAFAWWTDRHRDEFFRDWAAPLGMGEFIAGTAFWRADAMNWLAVVGHTNQSAISESDNIQVVRSLLPHIRRAADLHTRLQDGAVRVVGAEDVLAQFRYAVALLDPGGTLYYANHAWEVLLSGQDGLWADHDGRLHATRTWDESALQRVLRLATHGDDLGVRTGGRILISRERGALPLLLYIVPTAHADSPASIIAIVVDPLQRTPVSTVALQELFGLTPAEADTARRVAGGHGLQRVADEAGVTLSTVRIQLQRVFEKTGTHRQAELVSLLDALQTGIR